MTTLPEEIWKTVPGLQDVEASSLGRIRAILAQGDTSTGYKYVNIKHQGRSEQFSVHRLVAAAWHGLDLFDKRVFAMHLDDVRTHNEPTNLRTGSIIDNNRDTVEKGRQCKGEDVHWAKLNEKDVRRIRQLGRTFKLAELADLYETSESTIHRILSGETWKHVKD